MLILLHHPHSSLIGRPGGFAFLVLERDLVRAPWVEVLWAEEVVEMWHLTDRSVSATVERLNTLITEVTL